MALIEYPYINPIRVRIVEENTMVRIDKMANNTDYQRGIYANQHYRPNWLLNEELVIQVWTEIPLPFDLEINLSTPSGVVVITGSEVTPADWAAIPRIVHFNYTPTEEGEYYFFATISVGGDITHYASDVFLVKENENDLVEIKYYDLDNRYDALFYGIPAGKTTEELIWTPKAYYTGYAIPGPMKNTYSIFISDPGVPKKLNAEPQDTIKCVLADISFLEYKKLNRILSCDTIFVNSQPVQNEELPDADEFEKSDLVDLDIDFTEISTNSYVKNY